MSYQKLRKLYETGATIQEIANYFEVGSQYIYIRLKRSGATMRPSGLRCTPEAKQALKVKIAPTSHSRFK
jgi:transposase-like protein